MIISAMYMNTPEKMKRVGEVERKMLDLPAIVSDGKWKLEAVGTLKKFPNKDRSCKLHLELPKSILLGLPMPYGKQFTGKVGSHVFGPNWTNASFGLVPGDFWFSDYEFYFKGNEDPESASSILIYTDHPAWSYAGINNLPAFEFAPGLYGVILPINFIVQDQKIFSGYSPQDVMETMEYGLKMSHLTA